MSERAGKGQWHTNAAYISPNNIEAQLYRNDSVDDFLQNKYFIIAEKGIGKTLLLKKKRYDISQNNIGGSLFIPSNSELDIPADFTNLTYKQISLLEDISNTKILWTIAIQLSAIKKFYYYSSAITDEDKSRLPDLYVQILEDKRTYFTPSEVFHNLIKDISKILQYNNDYSSYINALYKQIHTPIYIFIDRLDQAMLIDTTEVSEEMWKTMQIGLLESAWNLKEHCNHIKIFCSIRKEAYNDYYSPVKSNMRGDICLLNYKEKELHELVNKLADYYEGKGKTIENIVGFGEDGKFTHSKTEREETVFKYMLRHTVEKPRDLIRIASTLKNQINLEADEETRIEELRVATNEAAEKIAEDIFTEKARFLDSLRDKYEREKFLSLIPKNTLNQKTINSICRAYNEIEESKCSEEQCKNNNNVDGCKHPFCELLNIGLFGYVQTDKPHKQVFKNPDKERVKHLTGLYSYYIIHPSLCEIIKRLRPNNRSKYIVTPGITTGNGYKWEQRESDISDLIDYVINAGLPEEKEKQIIKDLKDKIKDTENIKNLFVKTKKKIRKITKKPTIFLSYCGKDERTVNDIDQKLQELGLEVTRDKRDLRYKMDLSKFMESLKKHDYVVTVISDSYLKSKNCMFEIGKLLEEEGYKSKTLQIILPDADIFNDINKFQYIEFWTAEKQKLEEKLKQNLTLQNISLINKDIKDYDDIITNLPIFLEFVRGEKGMLLEDLKTSGYQTLDNVIRILILFLYLCKNLKYKYMIEIGDYFCPNEQCKSYGLRKQGNLIKAGTYPKQGSTKQMLRCKICGTRFSETRNTIFFNSHYDDVTIKNIICCIAEGTGVRATARIFGLSKDSVNSVVLKAGQYADNIMSNLLRNLHLTECQMDELWSFINKKNSVRRGFGA